MGAFWHGPQEAKHLCLLDELDIGEKVVAVEAAMHLAVVADPPGSLVVDVGDVRLPEVLEDLVRPFLVIARVRSAGVLEPHGLFVANDLLPQPRILGSLLLNTLPRGSRAFGAGKVKEFVYLLDETWTTSHWRCCRPLGFAVAPREDAGAANRAARGVAIGSVSHGFGEATAMGGLDCD